MRYLMGLTIPLLVLLSACGDKGDGAATTSGGAASASYEKTDDGVIVRPTTDGAADVRLEVVSDGVIRVSADPDGDFVRTPSLMRAGDASKSAPEFKVAEQDGHLRLSTARVTADVSLSTGRVMFLDAAGKPILSEVEGGRTFTPLEVEGKSYLSVRQRFESPDDEAIYGFGQHQQGWMNQKGRDVELLQHNVDMAVPFLVSSRNYGLLWDNNAITRMGDPRGLQPLPKSLKLYDAKGEEGALTARYSLDGVQKVERRESEVNYQYIKDLKNYPAEASSKDKPMQVTWEGEIEALSPGRHTFSLYSSEYAKLWIDGKLVIDRWRQNWNPWHHEFALELQPGQRHKLKIEADRSQLHRIAASRSVARRRSQGSVAVVRSRTDGGLLLRRRRLRRSSHRRLSPVDRQGRDAAEVGLRFLAEPRTLQVAGRTGRRRRRIPQAPAAHRQHRAGLVVLAGRRLGFARFR
jgi:alpha-D-xyloside xylohydrolase